MFSGWVKDKDQIAKEKVEKENRKAEKEKVRNEKLKSWKEKWSGVLENFVKKGEEKVDEFYEKMDNSKKSDVDINTTEEYTVSYDDKINVVTPAPEFSPKDKSISDMSECEFRHRLDRASIGEDFYGEDIVYPPPPKRIINENFNIGFSSSNTFLDCKVNTKNEKDVLSKLSPKELNELKLWTKAINEIIDKPHCNMCTFFQKHGVVKECHYEDNILFHSSHTGCFISFKKLAIDKNKNNECQNYKIKDKFKHLEEERCRRKNELGSLL